MVPFDSCDPKKVKEPATQLLYVNELDLKLLPDPLIGLFPKGVKTLESHNANAPI
jgi:hypothetical protein